MNLHGGVFWKSEVKAKSSFQVPSLNFNSTVCQEMIRNDTGVIHSYACHYTRDDIKEMIDNGTTPVKNIPVIFHATLK